MLVNSEQFCPTCNMDLDKICYYCASDETLILNYYRIRSKYKINPKCLKSLKSSCLNINGKGHITRLYTEDVEKLILKKYCKPNSEMYKEITKSLEHRSIRKERYMQIREELISLINKINDPIFDTFTLGLCNKYISNYYSDDQDNFTIVNKIYEAAIIDYHKNNEYKDAKKMLDKVLDKKFKKHMYEFGNSDEYHNTYEEILKNNFNQSLMTEFLKSEDNLKVFEDIIDLIRKDKEIEKYMESASISFDDLDYDVSINEGVRYNSDEITLDEYKILIKNNYFKNFKRKYVRDVVRKKLKLYFKSRSVKKLNYFDYVVFKNDIIYNYLADDEITEKSRDIEEVIDTIVRRKYEKFKSRELEKKELEKNELKI